MGVIRSIMAVTISEMSVASDGHILPDALVARKYRTWYALAKGFPAKKSASPINRGSTLITAS